MYSSTAFITSIGERWRAWSLTRSRYIMIAQDLAAIDQRREGAGLRHDLRPDLVPPDVEEGRLALGLAVECDQADRRHARRIIGQDDRRQGARRHRGILPPGVRIDLGQRAAAVDVAAEIVADDADADDRPRLQPPAAGRLAHAPLQPRRDVLLDAGRRHPAVEDQRLHRRALEDRQDVDRDRIGRQAAQHNQRQDHHRHGDRILQRSMNQAVHRSSLPSRSRTSNVRVLDEIRLTIACQKHREL